MKIQNFWLPAALLVAMSTMMFSCIVPVNTSMESARMLGTGNVEVTGSFSSYSLSSDGESVGINDNIGLRVGYGLSDKVDLKLRYIRLMTSGNSADNPDVNYLALIPKVSITDNRFAAVMPIGLYFATVDGESSDTWFVSPRLIYTYPLPNDKVEFSVSSKADFYFEEDTDPTIGFTLGAGFSSDLSKWAIRPEFGLLFFTGDSEGTSLNFGIGGTVNFGGN
jgi:hypothetical protein